MKTQETNENKYKKRRKYKKKSGKKRTWIKHVILLILFLSALIAFALSPVFNIKKIEVRGNQHIKSDDLINATDIIIGSNGFKTIGSNLRNIVLLRYGKAENNIIKSQPYVKSVSVKLSIPDKVVINVTERKPICVVPYNEINLIMDDEGYILDTVNKNVKNSLLTVNGLKFKNYKIGQALKLEKADIISYIKKITDLIAESDKTSSLKLEKLLTSIDLSQLRNITATFDSRITVNFSDLTELDYRLAFLREIYLTQIKKEDKGFLDFTEDGNFTFTPKK